MFANEGHAGRPWSADLHRWARKERARAIALSMYGAARLVATGLHAFMRIVDRVARDLLGAIYRRSAVRALQRADDLMLADIGVPRCEIEAAVRAGRRARSIGKIERNRHNWRHFPLERKAAFRSKKTRGFSPEGTESVL